MEKYLKNISGLQKYVMMPNHVHMILQTEEHTPSDVIRSFKTMVTKEIGTPIFQRSFYDHVIRNEQDYQAVWKYIDENPIKWAEDELYI